MGIATSTALIGGAALAGGVAGSKGKKSTTQIGAQTSLGGKAEASQKAQLRQFQQFANQGPGMQDYQAGIAAQRGLAGIYEEAQMGANAGDIERGQQFARDIFAPQRQALSQAFEDQLKDANRAAALAGRGGFDPILRAKLAQEQTRQGTMLEAQQGAFGAQQAQNMFGQRIGFAADRANILSGIGQQALSNRQNVFSAANQIAGQQNALRMGQTTTTSGGGFAGALTGAIGGASAGLGMSSGINSLTAKNPFVGYAEANNNSQMASNIYSPTYGMMS